MENEVAVATQKMFVSPYFVSTPGKFGSTGKEGEEFASSHSVVYKPLFIKIGDRWNHESTPNGHLFVKKTKQSLISFVLENSANWLIS